MTTSIDPSVDELLSLQENQYHLSNFVFANVKPIGAERKIGQLSHFPLPIKSSLVSPKRFVNPMNMDFVAVDTQDNPNYMNSFESMSVYDHPQFSSIEEPVMHRTNNESKSVTHYHPFHSHSLISSSHIPDNYHNQRQTPSSINQPRSHTIKTSPSVRIPQSYPTSRFISPQFTSRNAFLNICQQTRSTPPVFTPPFQYTRERFSSQFNWSSDFTC